MMDLEGLSWTVTDAAGGTGSEAAKKAARQKVFQLLILACTGVPDALECVYAARGEDNPAYHAWKALKDKYASDSATNVHSLNAQLSRLRFVDFPSLKDFLSAVRRQHTLIQATESDAAMPESNVCAHVYKELPSDYRSVCGKHIVEDDHKLGKLCDELVAFDLAFEISKPKL